MSSAPKNIKEYIGNLPREMPDKVISEIRVDLEAFIDEIIKYDLHDLYLVGRKSRHLFHPLISSRLVEKSPGIHFLKVFSGIKNGAQVCIIGELGKDVPREISLLADSINEGKEKEEIVNILKKKYDCTVNKIFCYVANQQGIDYLLNNKVFTRDQIIALHTIPNAEYKQFSNRLEMYYQSRIEPMDVEHVFKMHSFATKISSEELFRFFKDATKTGLDCDKGEYAEAEEITEKDVAHNILFVPETIKNYNFHCLDFSSCKACCKAKRSKLFADTKAEYVQIRLKAELKETESTLCLVVFCPPDPDSFPIDIIKTNKCKNNNCQVQQVVYDESGLSQDEITAMICSQCIENQLSEPILDSVMDELKRKIEEKRKNEPMNKSP